MMGLNVHTIPMLSRGVSNLRCTRNRNWKFTDCRASIIDYNIVVNIRVLVVADDSLARAGLATLLNQQANLLVVGQIASADFAGAIDLYRPDVIVWDSAQAIATINLRDTRAPSIILLAAVDDATTAWSAGARGILPRDASIETMASAIAAVADGLIVIDPVFAAALFPTRDSSSAQPVEELTPRELQVLRLIAEGQSNKTIARELGISEHTVKFHVNAILGKLNAQSRTEAVVIATRLGLILL